VGGAVFYFFVCKLCRPPALIFEFSLDKKQKIKLLWLNIIGMNWCSVGKLSPGHSQVSGALDIDLTAKINLATSAIAVRLHCLVQQKMLRV
jgi:hypothetical protein